MISDRLLSAIRRLLKNVDIRIERRRRGVVQSVPKTNGLEEEMTRFLLSIEHGNPSDSAYLQAHLQRLVRTLTLVPPHGRRALELGSYGHMAAALKHVAGYADVRGAYYGEPGADRKTLPIRNQPGFILDVDLFDAERHPFPYADGEFDLVLCCELIEHLIRDPMHMLFECHRILSPGGLLVLTTPNTASYSSVACALHGWRNPQVFSTYPAPGHADTPHVREYTPREIADAVTAAGFEVEALFTERAAAPDEGAWVKALLEREGFDTALRGEQTYCVARKQTGLPRDRHPNWLYDK